MAHPIFIEKKFNTDLFLNGFRTFSLMDKNDVKRLISIRQNLDLIFKNGIHISMENETPSSRQAIQNELNRILKPCLNRAFTNYQNMLTSFIIKTNDHNPIGYHRDWTFVDESKGQNSYTLWIPLQDTTAHNGGIKLIPGSHLNYHKPRILPMHFNSSSDFKVKLELEKAISLTAGEAVIWNNKLLHASYPNQSPQERIVVTSLIHSSKASKTLYYKKSNEENIKKYKYSATFFNSNNSSTFLDCFKRKTIPYGLMPTE